jgi:two-component system cell cycle sensor histidine kinase/response regulator CckA
VVRDVVLSALEEEGYQVRVARDGVEGRELFEQDPGGFDLIISDVVMPRATGPEMVEALEAAGHRPRVLFISGYTNDALTARQRLREGVDLVQKPFTARHLVGRVREILNASAAR